MAGSNENDNNALSTKEIAAIIGGVIGGIAFIVVFVGLLMYFLGVKIRLPKK